jgi:hypothetical protein
VADLVDQPQVGPAQRGRQVVGHRRRQGVDEAADVAAPVVSLDRRDQPAPARLNRVQVAPEDGQHQAVLAAEVVVEGRLVAGPDRVVELPRGDAADAAAGEEEGALLQQGLPGPSH